jgi:S1-C subfamily serine protease
MSRITQNYKRTLAGSVGAGLSSVFGSGGKQYYILEHKISSRYHRAGENQEIIVDQVEIGRDGRCQVRFDESFPTVSRRHAAIIREGDKWKLIHLSETNPTLLNNNNVAREWYLQNGDEIQLSVGGPRLGFIIPAGRTTGTIGLTRRLSLFGQQALRPYKRAITLLTVALVLAIGGLTGWKIWSDIEHKEQIAKLEAEADAREAEAKAQYEQFQAEQDSIATVLENTNKDLTDVKQRNAELSNRLKKMQSSQNTNVTPGRVGITAIDNKAIEACLPYIYFIYVESIEAISPTGEKKIIDNYGWTGTGFLLNDGRFVTARHVVEPWFFAQKGEDNKIAMNYLVHNGGNVIVHFGAISSSGDRFSFTNEHIVCNRAHDHSVVTDEGYKYVVGYLDETDWAYWNVGRNDGLTMDKQASISLERGVELTVLGFPMALGANSADDIKPIWSNALTASQGLTRSVILTTNTNYEHGNSGGPVFYTDANGKLIVIGIVSAHAGRSTGFIVPIASLF